MLNLIVSVPDHCRLSTLLAIALRAIVAVFLTKLIEHLPVLCM